MSTDYIAVNKKKIFNITKKSTMTIKKIKGVSPCPLQSRIPLLVMKVSNLNESD
jgi:hypothetical protein